TRSTAEPPGGEIRRDKSGEPTGVFTETAMRLVADVIPPPTDAELREMIVAATRRQLSMGITAATDPGVDNRVLRVYREMDAAGELPGRYNVMRLAPEDPESEAMAEWRPPTTSDHLRVDTAKLFMDGGLSGATAALSVPYRHANTTGVLRYDAKRYGELCCKATDAGYRVATHVIGDRAIATALDAWEQLPEAARNARFEHFGLPTERDLQRTANLGIGIATQPIFLPELGANFREYLPDDFPVTPYPIQQMQAAGLRVALSTDAPVVVDERPLAGIAAAVHRLDGDGQPIGLEESIPLREALLGYTNAGAELTGDAKRFGSITPGLAADLVVLDRSPLDTRLDELADIGVDLTFVDGEIVYQR
ncbi:MAG: amidohydrolase family protein, partial [Planctomycetota bacterium]